MPRLPVERVWDEGEPIWATFDTRCLVERYSSQLQRPRIVRMIRREHQVIREIKPQGTQSLVRGPVISQRRACISDVLSADSSRTESGYSCQYENSLFMMAQF